MKLLLKVVANETPNKIVVILKFTWQPGGQSDMV